MELDREVIRCQVCGLVQYRTRTGNCRRCLRLMPPKVAFVIPTPSPQDLPGDDRQLFENWPNRETVENIGQRIRQLTRVAWDDAEPTAGALARFPLVFVADRKRSDDAQPRHARKDSRSVGSRAEPVLRSGDEWRDGARGSVHSGSSAIPAAAGLGAVARHSEEAASDQRAREYEQRAADGGAVVRPDAPYNAPATAAPRPFCIGDPSVAETRRASRDSRNDWHARLARTTGTPDWQARQARMTDAHNEIWVSPAQPRSRRDGDSVGDKPGDSDRGASLERRTAAIAPIPKTN